MTEYSVGEIPLILRRHPRARSLKLRYDAKAGAALLTLPPGVAERKALQFAEKHTDWIQRQVDQSPDSIRLLPGAIIPFRGIAHPILHYPHLPAQVHPSDHKLTVGGPLEGFETRLQNWLQKQARHDLTKAVERLSPQISPQPHRIMVRDIKSRWGSCSSKKTLSFSWRLIMAPQEILTYVVAHEMAHLVEMNHGPAFWKLVEQMDPHWKKSRRWLKSEGSKLMVIG